MQERMGSRLQELVSQHRCQAQTNPLPADQLMASWKVWSPERQENPKLKAQTTEL
jgi:hypothetical protein